MLQIKPLIALCKRVPSLFLQLLKWIGDKHSIFISIMTVIVSICSYFVAKTQADLAAISLYPHFQVIQQTGDTDEDSIQDTVYITVSNHGGNFYSFQCSLASFFQIHDYRADPQEYLVPINGLFVVGFRSYEQPVIYTKKCDQYLNYAHLPYELETENCYIGSIQTYVRITYQNINLDTVVEYFDSRTGRRLSSKEGAYYFDDRLYPKTINDFYSSHELYAGDSQAVVLNKVNDILNSKDEMVSSLLIPLYQKK